MTANKKLFAVLLVVLAVLLFVSWSREKENQTVELQTTKQAVISSQTTTDGANRQYLALRDKNIQKQKEVAENAVFEEDELSVPDVVADFCDLVDRAREHNDNIRQRKGGN